ncbi:MAG: restriction endonuclease subunit S [Sandaracinaceae bacterium]|nr:restriction endonuclease subunit S [Sandaracinaceae bacterium]
MRETHREWLTTILGSVAEWRSGGTPSKSREDYWSGDIPWLSPKDMKVFALSDTQDHLSLRALADGARYAPAATVFIVVRGMILAHTFPVCVAEKPMAFNQDVKAVVPNALTDGRFLAHWFVGRSHALLGLVTEATHGTKRIDLKELLEFRISLPSVPEQARIAEILDTVDDAIRKTEEIIAKLEQVKQGLLHDLLTRGIDDNGELRDPERHPEQFKDSPNGRIPRPWATLELGRCLLGSPYNGIYKPAHLIGRGTLLIGQAAFTADRTIDFSMSRRAMLSSAEVDRYRLIPGDILVSRVFATLNGVGQPVLVRELPEPAVYESNMMRLRIDQHLMRPPWVFHCLRGRVVRRLVESGATLSNQASINQGTLLRLPIPAPEIHEQERILERLSALDCRREAEQSELAKLQLLKQGLMEDLLTGRVRVTNLLGQAAE